jgi:zinc finger protein
MAHKSLAQDLFEDMGRKVAEASAQEADEDGNKVVDEIESLCMNCHENVTTCFSRCVTTADHDHRERRAFY